MDVVEREPYSRAFEVCKHTSLTNPFTFVPVYNANQLYYGTWRCLWNLADWHVNMCISWGYPSMGSRNQDPLRNSMANFKTYWAHIKEILHSGITKVWMFPIPTNEKSVLCWCAGIWTHLSPDTSQDKNIYKNLGKEGKFTFMLCNPEGLGSHWQNELSLSVMR